MAVEYLDMRVITVVAKKISIQTMLGLLNLEERPTGNILL